MPSFRPAACTTADSHYLVHPTTMRLRDDSGDAHAAGRQADDKENVITDQTNSGPHFDSEEICGGHDLPVSPQKLVPRSRSATLRSRIESRALEDTGHRGSSDSLSEIFECALNAGM